jgi:hypothetical protein
MGLLLFELLSLMYISIALGIKRILKVLCLLHVYNVHDNQSNLFFIAMCRRICHKIFVLRIGRNATMQEQSQRNM